jgi:hypothetical protein
MRKVASWLAIAALAMGLVQCGGDHADAGPGESDDHALFPIGVYFVRGQKPIADEGDPTDFRRDPETARAAYAREFGDLVAEGFNTAVMVVDPVAYGDRYEEVLAAMLGEPRRRGFA